MNKVGISVNNNIYIIESINNNNNNLYLIIKESYKLFNSIKCENLSFVESQKLLEACLKNIGINLIKIINNENNKNFIGKIDGIININKEKMFFLKRIGVDNDKKNNIMMMQNYFEVNENTNFEDLLDAINKIYTRA